MESEEYVDADDEKWEELEITIRSILTTFKNGCPMSLLFKEYKETCGEVLPYFKLGYRNATELLQDIPHVVRFGYDKDGDSVLFAVATEDTQHVATLVRRQKSTQKKKAGKKPMFSTNFRRRPDQFQQKRTWGPPKPHQKVSWTPSFGDRTTATNSNAFRPPPMQEKTSISFSHSFEFGRSTSSENLRPPSQQENLRPPTHDDRRSIRSNAFVPPRMQEKVAWSQGVDGPPQRSSLCPEALRPPPQQKISSSQNVDFGWSTKSDLLTQEKISSQNIRPVICSNPFKLNIPQKTSVSTEGNIGISSILSESRMSTTPEIFRLPPQKEVSFTQKVDVESSLISKFLRAPQQQEIVPSAPQIPNVRMSVKEFRPSLQVTISSTQTDDRRSVSSAPQMRLPLQQEETTILSQRVDRMAVSSKSLIRPLQQHLEEIRSAQNMQVRRSSSEAMRPPTSEAVVRAPSSRAVVRPPPQYDDDIPAHLVFTKIVPLSLISADGAGTIEHAKTNGFK